MITSDVIEAIKMALEKIEKRYISLSQKDYSKVIANPSLVERFSEDKVLERPFAYEFYHQFRNLINKGIVDFGSPIIQAEVDKTYQHCFENNDTSTKKGKIPDFLVHLPDKSEQNLAVVEFKLATNLAKIESDLSKLVEFKTNKHLHYDYGVEVIIGDSESLKKAKANIEKLEKTEGEEIWIVYFNTDSMKANSQSHLHPKSKSA
jgi:hypothetical protein